MNTKFYITTEIENNQFVGKVFSVNTNQLVYTSKPYNSKEQAMADARTYVITSAPPVTDPNPPKTIISTATYTALRPVHSVSTPTRRCCGR